MSDVGFRINTNIRTTMCVGEDMGLMTDCKDCVLLLGLLVAFF